MAGEKKTFTLEELKQFDGKGASGKIYVALNGKVFDVTEKGKQHYGTGAPYEVFAGGDISRAMATMTMTCSETYDDLSDLNPAQRESLERWEQTFVDKYEVIGALKKS